MNYILLTLIADKAAGVPYEEYVTRTILVPLGMNDTYFPHTSTIPGPHMQAQLRDANGTVRDYTGLYIQFDRGAGDIISTTGDMNRFHRALREGKIISKTSLADMEKGTPQSGKKGYGLGYTTGQVTPPGITVQGHTGGYRDRGPSGITCRRRTVHYVQRELCWFDAGRHTEDQGCPVRCPGCT